MMVVSICLALLLGALAGLHVFWALGGSWGRALAIPERDGAPLFRPSRTVTWLVAVGLITAAVCAVVSGTVVAVPGTRLAAQAGCWVLAVVFGVRAIGEGRYVGFTKRVRATEFGRNDTWLYSPLCTAMAVGFLVLALA
jgi:hypothetical protein